MHATNFDIIPPVPQPLLSFNITSPAHKDEDNEVEEEDKEEEDKEEEDDDDEEEQEEETEGDTYEDALLKASTHQTGVASAQRQIERRQYKNK